MRIIGCDLHSRQQTLAMLDTATGELEKTTLKHEENIVREFYSQLPRPVRVGIEPTRQIENAQVTDFTYRQKRPKSQLSRTRLRSGYAMLVLESAVR